MWNQIHRRRRFAETLFLIVVLLQMSQPKHTHTAPFLAVEVSALYISSSCRDIIFCWYRISPINQGKKKSESCTRDGPPDTFALPHLLKCSCCCCCFCVITSASFLFIIFLYLPEVSCCLPLLVRSVLFFFLPRSSSSALTAQTAFIGRFNLNR